MNELLAIRELANEASLSEVVQVVAWTLLHFYWQGALVAAALAGALALLGPKRFSAQARYSVACGALVLMAALPVLTAGWLASREIAASGEAAARATAEAVGTVPALGAVLSAGSKSTPSELASAPAPTSGQLKAGRSLIDPALPWLVGLWLVGVVALASVHFGGWLRVRRLKTQGVRPVAESWRQACRRLAGRLGIRRPVELLESTRVVGPVAIGWLKPVVLFPASTFTGLNPRQLESILAHELAHVRRHDYLINVLQMALETVLFYHPAVWWASRQVRELREHCCDDLAVAVCGDRMIYARALADLEQLRGASPQMPVNAYALGANGGSLLVRIRRLVGQEAGSRQAPSWAAGALALTALVATATLMALAGQPGWAQEPTSAIPGEISSRSVPLVAPVILAQVSEEMGSSLPASSSEPTSQPAVGGDEAPSRQVTFQGAPIPIDDLIEMKIHGLDDLLDEVEGTAYEQLTTQQLLDLARYGVDRELLDELRQAGYGDLQANELMELAKFGIDGELIAELRSAGYDHLSVEELVELAKFGIDGELIQELADAGFRNLNILELVELAKFGVDGELIQELRDAGYASSSTAGLVELAKFGVDGELIAELTELGLSGLTTEQLVELAKFGVDGEYILELREAGVEDLSVDDLTRMARHGIDAEFLNRLSQRNQI